MLGFSAHMGLYFSGFTVLQLWAKATIENSSRGRVHQGTLCALIVVMVMTEFTWTSKYMCK